MAQWPKEALQGLLWVSGSQRWRGDSGFELSNPQSYPLEEGIAKTEKLSQVIALRQGQEQGPQAVDKASSERGWAGPHPLG